MGRVTTTSNLGRRTAQLSLVALNPETTSSIDEKVRRERRLNFSSRNSRPGWFVPPGSGGCHIQLRSFESGRSLIMHRPAVKTWNGLIAAIEGSTGPNYQTSLYAITSSDSEQLPLFGHHARIVILAAAQIGSLVKVGSSAWNNVSASEP